MDKNMEDFLKEKARRLRIDSVVATSEAGSGHPTSCLSAADLVAALFFHVMRYDPHDPANPLNDRFILSKGHAAPILYAAWSEAGLFPTEKLKSLRQVNSELEGHPTPKFAGADVATGSLGQGLSMGLGMALNGKYLDKSDYRVYVLLGDGETAEGAIWEAAELAAYYKLNNLIAIVDVNGLGQSQRTMYNFNIEIYKQKFSAFGWHAIAIDGHDFSQILPAFQETKNILDKPVAIVARTLKGKGVSFLEDREGWHGKPLKKGAELEQALKELDGTRLPATDLEWKIQTPPPKQENKSTLQSREMAPPTYKPDEKVATREAYGTALVKLGAANPLVVALDGDTKNSTFSEKFMAAYPNRFFESFIAEQNMLGAAVGLASRGKIPFVSTFAAFFARAYDQIRMAGIAKANIKLAGSHAGVSIGEDGPSQMGLEDLAMMRAVPNAAVLYPADAVATEKLVAEMAKYKGIAYIRLSRPKTGIVYSNDEALRIGGCKVVRSNRDDQITVVAAGVTLFQALHAYEELKSDGISIRVIDAYSLKPIARDQILNAANETNKIIITVEDHYFEGGLGDAVMNAVNTDNIKVYKLAVRDVPRSGKPEELLDMFCINSDSIIHKVKNLLLVRTR